MVLNQPVPCSKCGAELEHGAKAYLGMSDDPTPPRAWLCADAVDSLEDDAK